MSFNTPHKLSWKNFDGIPYREVKQLNLKFYILLQSSDIFLYSLFRSIFIIHYPESSQTVNPILAILQNLQL